jgi:recombination protein RecT
MGNKIEAAKEKRPVTVEDHLRFGMDFRKELKKVLGKVPPEHFVRVALTAMQKQPKLANCTQASIFQCLLDCASVDLEPDGRRAHLIPYGETCTLVIDYKGYVDLMTRPGKGNEVAFIDAAIVYDKDDFEWNMNRVMRHRFDIKADDRGEPIAAYVAINYKNGMVKFEMMVKKEILSIKERSKAVIAAKKYKNFQTPWYTDELEMWKKCPLRRAAKWVPINDQTARAMEVDYDRFEEMEQPGPKGEPPTTPILGDPKPEPEKKMPKPKQGEEQPPDEEPGEGSEEQREPGQDDEEPEEGEKPEPQDAKAELMKLLSATCRGDAGRIAVQLKRLTKYESKKTGRKSEGKSDIESVSKMEAEIALAKLRVELGFNS